MEDIGGKIQDTANKFQTILGKIQSSLKAEIVKMFIVIVFCVAVLLIVVTFFVASSATDQLAENSSQVKMSSDNLSTLAETLNGMVARFKSEDVDLRTGIRTINVRRVQPISCR